MPVDYSHGNQRELTTGRRVIFHGLYIYCVVHHPYLTLESVLVVFQYVLSNSATRGPMHNDFEQLRLNTMARNQLRLNQITAANEANTMALTPALSQVTHGNLLSAIASIASSKLVTLSVKCVGAAMGIAPQNDWQTKLINCKLKELGKNPTVKAAIHESNRLREVQTKEKSATTKQRVSQGRAAKTVNIPKHNMHPILL